MSTRNDYWAYLQPQNEDVMHYGVKGMKWGVRKDRYESYKTRSLRYKLEYGGLRDRKRERVYNKYNRSKDRDLKRVEKANMHPSHGRNIAAYLGKATLYSAGLALAAGAIYTARSKIGKAVTVDQLIAAEAHDAALVKKLKIGSKVAGFAIGSQLLYKHIEQGKAIAEVRRDGPIRMKR